MRESRYRPIVTLHLRGGFANQLFQWAAIEWLRTRHDFDLVVDVRSVERPHDRGDQITFRGLEVERVVRPGRPARFVWNLLYRLLPIGVFTRLSAIFAPPRRRSLVATTLMKAEQQLAEGRSVVMHGYYQEVDLFMEIRDVLRERIGKHFAGSSNDPQPERVVHVRRGDYASVPSNLEKFGLCSPSYYAAAAEGVSVVVVTDDPEWSRRELLPTLPPGSAIGGGASLIGDFVLLSGANEIVLSNSTFSWWAAFLGSHTKVTAPVPWMQSGDSRLVLPGWRRLDKATGASV